MDPYSKDSDGDGVSDGDELQVNSDPLGHGNMLINLAFTHRLSGRIVLQVQQHGEAWYINPTDNRRYYLGTPSDAFDVMRFLGLGIAKNDLDAIPILPKVQLDGWPSM